MYISHRGEAPPAQWMPLTPSATVYVGSLVYQSGEGVTACAAASGAGDTSGNTYIAGLAIGTNLKTPNYNSTYKTEYITDAGAAGPHSNTTEYFGVEGPWSKGDSGNMAMVLVEKIWPWTVLRAPLYNGAVGTAPTLLTATAGNASGLQVVTNATQFTPIGELETIYCRSGANRGVYRVTDDSDTETCTWDRAMPADTAAGDTFVRVPIRNGLSYTQINSTCGSWLEASHSPATNYYHIWVHRLDLSVAGEEFAEFSFDPVHIMAGRGNI